KKAPGTSHYSFSGRRRARLRSDRRRLASSRAAFTDAGTRVGLRRLGRASALATTVRSRSVTDSRFRSWLRVSPDTKRSRPAESRRGARRARRRALSSSVTAADAAMSQTTSILVDDVLTCCPPGPLERDARYVSSLSGIRSVAVISTNPSADMLKGKRSNPRHQRFRLAPSGLSYCHADPPRAPGASRRARPSGAGLLGWGGLGPVGGGGASGARSGADACCDRAKRFLSRRSVANRRRPRQAIRRATPRGRHSRARRPAVRVEYPHPMLLLQDRAVEPAPRDRGRSRLRCCDRRHQRG